MSEIKEIKQFGKTTLIMDIISFVLVWITTGILINFQINYIFEALVNKNEELFENSLDIIKVSFLSLFALISLIVGLVALVFKIMISRRIPSLYSKKLADAKLYYVLSIFFGIIFTFMGYKKLESFEYPHEVAQEEKINIQKIKKDCQCIKCIKGYEYGFELFKLQNATRLTLIFEIMSIVVIQIISITIVLIINSIVSDANKNSLSYDPTYYSSFELTAQKARAGFVFVIILFIVYIGLCITTFVFKIISATKLSNFKASHLKTSRIFFIISIFFGLVFTALAYRYVKKHKKEWSKTSNY
ncbi:hypothetical protein [Mycoplasma sp. 1012]